MNIVLIGYRGAGKTVVGKQLASHLGMKFIDIDHLIEERYQKRIIDIVESKGWDYFRNIEKRFIQEISRQDHLVIAPGGGAVLDVNNIIALKKKGFIIWLKADPEILHRRLEEDQGSISQRPPLTDKGSLEEIKEVLAERNPLYERASEAQLDTTILSVKMVVDRVLSLLQERIGRL